MKFKNRIKTYKFWVALSASLIILLQALGDAFGFTISEKIIDGIVMGFCGVLVVFGFVERPEKSSQDESESVLKNQNKRVKIKSNKSLENQENLVINQNEKSIELNNKSD